MNWSVGTCLQSGHGKSTTFVKVAPDLLLSIFLFPFPFPTFLEVGVDRLLQIDAISASTDVNSLRSFLPVLLSPDSLLDVPAIGDQTSGQQSREIADDERVSRRHLWHKYRRLPLLLTLSSILTTYSTKAELRLRDFRTQTPVCKDTFFK